MGLQNLCVVMSLNTLGVCFTSEFVQSTLSKNFRAEVLHPDLLHPKSTAWSHVILVSVGVYMMYLLLVFHFVLLVPKETLSH